MSLCKEQPYAQLSDEAVIENTGQFYERNGKPVLLSKPNHCPYDLYELMKRCWKREPSERPLFEFLHTFLKARNIGYQPPADVWRSSVVMELQIIIQKITIFIFG